MAPTKHWDLWRNGNADAQIRAGTYADFREELLANYYYTPEQIKSLDEQLEALGDDEIQKRRTATADNLETRLRPHPDYPGRLTKRAVPSGDTVKTTPSADKKKAQQERIKKVFPDGVKLGRPKKDAE